MAMMTLRRWRRGFLLTSQELNVDQIDSSNNLPGREPLMKPTQMCHTPDWIILLFSFFYAVFQCTCSSINGVWLFVLCLF